MLKIRKYAISSTYNWLLCTSPPKETVEHLFFHCRFSSSCWNEIGIQWPLQNSRLDIVHTASNSWTGGMFMEILMIGAWSIWKESNNKLFNVVDPSVTSWKRRFKTDFQLLVHRTKPELHQYINNFVDSL
jgi:hypothetical protein